MRNKDIKGNKGEWSEFYAFLKILTDRKLFAADENLEIIRDRFYLVLCVIKNEIGSSKKVYDISEEENTINVVDEKGNIIDTILNSEISSKSISLFERIKNGSKGAFGIDIGRELMDILHCTKIKSESTNKSDISVILYDQKTPSPSEVGFSIKSMIGAPSTLLNAGKTTNFVYKILNLSIDNRTLNTLNSKNRFSEKISGIKNEGGKLIFEKVGNNTFSSNLRKIDSIFPKIISSMLIIYYEGRGSTLQDIYNELIEDENLLSDIDMEHDTIMLNIKEFLIAIALGMTPNTNWDGLMKTSGGYIIVKENGDIVCYHVYNRDKFMDYLFKNTRFETASTTRHGFGKLYKEKNKYYINLNLQIRFVK
jgi:type II restriction enzyme